MLMFSFVLAISHECTEYSVEQKQTKTIGRERTLGKERKGKQELLVVTPRRRPVSSL